jgi:hypothetical protein
MGHPGLVPGRFVPPKGVAREREVAAVALPALVIVGCGDRSRSACPPATQLAEIPVPAVHTTTLVNTRVSAHADLQGGIALSIDDNQGTLTFDAQPMRAVVFQSSPWPALDWIVFSGLAMSDDAWFPFWLDCTPDGRLAQISIESTQSGIVTNLPASGTCADPGPAGFWSMNLDLPALTLREVNLTCGFEVQDPAWDVPLELAGSRAGSTLFEGARATVLVYAVGDCRQACGPGPPWYELHSLIWEPASAQVGFTIWYLEGTRSGTGVFTSNGFLLPAASSSWTLSFPSASWTLMR